MTNTIAVFKSQFFGATPVYLRGGMNGWGTDNQFIYNQGEYSLTLDVSAGSVEFKVADADWANINDASR
jgi:pullulanase